MVYTEFGLLEAEKTWDAFYHEKAEECGSKHEPETPEMETCFGGVYDADAKVAEAVQVAVALLRGYWTARAAGEDPDWSKVATRVQALIEDLPPQARGYFERIEGLR